LLYQVFSIREVFVMNFFPYKLRQGHVTIEK
jgi:hypothetical protein